MKIPMVSIIIPVYNAEKYLSQCLNSLLEQTFADFEIICVDDGSTDNSLMILKEYEQKDDRIIVIEQKNQYAGVARNNGMKRAKGKYLLFLDADDYFADNMLEELAKRAEKDRTEILVFDVFQYDNALKKVINTAWRPIKKNLFGEGIKSARDIADTIFDFTTSAPWNKLFLREFVIKNNLQFQAIQRTNDLYFVYTAFSYAERIGICDKKLLFYRDNNASSLQGTGDITPNVFSKALFALRDNLQNRGILDIYSKSFDNMALAVCIYNLNNMNNIEAYYSLFHSLQSEIFPKLCLGSDVIEPQMELEVSQNKNLIIYGAGAVAKAFVRFLLLQCGYEKKNISVVVSELGHDEMDICGIKVNEFSTISESRNSNLVVIAVSEERIYNEIKKSVEMRGFHRTAKVGFHEMATLIRNYLKKKDCE